MDHNTILQCFAATLDQNFTIRSDAETHLKQFSSNQGFLQICLDIISSNEVDDSIKMAASLYFKNKIATSWNSKSSYASATNTIAINKDEKLLIRDLLIQTMLKCSKNSPRCIKVLKYALSEIILNDYPEKSWESLLPQSFELLSNSNNDIDTINIALICISEVFRTYRWKYNDARQDLEVLIMEYFPSLLTFANDVLFNNGTNMNNQQIGDLTKLVIKTYKFVSYYDLPFVLQRQEFFIPWANFFVTIIQQDLPIEFLNSTANDPSSRSRNPWVKCKKWAMGNIYRLFSRYAVNSITKKFEYNDFKTVFLNEFSPQFLQLLFQQIEKWGNANYWLSDESLYYSLSFFEQCISMNSTWKLISSHYLNILQHIIFPLLTPNEDTLETFENDPQEYIHRNLELWDDDYSPDLAAISFIVTAVHKRSKRTLEPTLDFIIQALQSNMSNGNDITLNNAVQIESSLRMFSSIIDKLTQQDSPYLNHLDGFLKKFVIPFFNSNFAILRTRVCEICSKLNPIDIKDPENRVIIFNGIVSCFNESKDDSLPVNLSAALALQVFIDDNQFKQVVSEYVIPMMERLLQLSNDFETDAISGVMQEFVEQFAEQLQPFGVELMNNLVQQFLKLAIELNEAANFDPNTIINVKDMPDEGDKQMAAIGILSTAISILLSFENSPDIVKNLEQSFYPAAEFILKNNMEDFYRELNEFIENSTFLLRSINPIIWKILELIGDNNKNENSMIPFYLEDFMLSLNNIIIYGKEELCKNEFYTKIIIEIYEKAIQAEENTLDDMKNIFQLSQMMILALGDHLPSIFKEKFLTDVMKAIIEEKEDGLKKHIVFAVTSYNVITASLCSSSPTLTLQFLKQHNCLELFLQLWFTNFIPNYTRVYDIKLSLIAVLNICCNMTTNAFHTLGLESLLDQIGKVVVQLIAKLPIAIKELNDKKREFSNFDANKWDDSNGVFDKAFNDDDEIDENADDDEVNGDEEADDVRKLMDMLEKDNGDDYQFVHSGTFNEADSFDDLEEDPLTESILHNIDAFSLFKESFANLEQNDVTRYQTLMHSLSEEEIQILRHTLSL
ncbi:Nmd5p NDAI_0J02880 [Naumovozyma dairenensis CBS 421]|uniref:Importin N-terminal domain-containing protein n=1 Tax=Naumovozyma dairenensis (strain ATCC 10597 / BCRC 20456 / CBS 421 / NBRC 0211 / NRRL Y-12639) TaxID=1071378 RepID=G0WHA2_NAUDC|nr:hypothetical protein NDAI_0J02880 [Naumovozyma dairenensis CBS 421]CCD27180.1 hypothetical protein NDAI_0J02880 [Naumovozyma dairenensis CBS 421]